MFSDRRYTRTNFGGTNNIAVPTIILICVVVYFLQQVTAVRVGNNFSYSPITHFFSLFSPKIKEFQFWRFITYMFLHGNFWHLLINMWGLYLFGSLLEREIGTAKFLKLFFISGIFGGILWTVFNLNSYIPCVGASAALFGIMAGAAMLYPDMMIMLIFPPIPLKLKTFVIIYALIESFSSIAGIDSYVAHLAHIGGLIGGYFYMRKLYPQTFNVFSFIAKYLPTNKHKRTQTYSQKASKSWTIKNPLKTKTIDEILDKISQSGINSLTEDEIQILKEAREKMRQRN